MKNLNISDVARLANVSTTTVSRYLNGKYQYMSAETQAIIRDTIQKYGYRPSQVARSLKTKKSNLIAIVCPGVTVQSSPLFLQGVDGFLQNINFDYVVLSSGSDFSRECNCLDRCLDLSVDGILYSPACENIEKAIEVNNSGIPVVLFDRFIEKWSYSGVYVNHAGIVNCMLEELCKRGYKDIRLLAGTYQSPDTRYQREQIFLKYVSEHKGSGGDKQIEILRFKRGNMMQESVTNVIEQYLKEESAGSRALFAVDMQTLHAVMQAREQLHFNIPGDFALCGYDSQDYSNLMSPKITYIEQPFYEMGYEAAKMLVEHIENKKVRSRHTVWIEGTIHFGESTPECGR